MSVSITQRDVDRVLSTTASEAGEDTVELQVQKLTLLVPGKLDQAVLARRLAEADGLRQKFGGCKTMPDLARAAADVRYEDLKYIKPSSIGRRPRASWRSGSTRSWPNATCATSGKTPTSNIGERSSIVASP